MNQNINSMDNMFESPLLIENKVELEQVIATSGQASRILLDYAAVSKEETRTDNNSGGEYDIDM